MNERTTIPSKGKSGTFTPGGLLQRRCACGHHTMGHECTECRKKREGRPRGEGSHPSPGLDEPAILAGQRVSWPRFDRVRTMSGAQGGEIRNSFGDHEEDPIHRPLIDQFREREHLPPGGRDEEGNPAGPSDAEIKYGGLLMPCPNSTEVAATIDMRSAALTAGFRTVYGIHAQMRVRPDGRTWDGTQIVESLTPGANTCPDTLTRGAPCSGGSTFTVGAASGNSSVLTGPRPGARNRFWDFHTTHVRPRGVSVLHDATRNPANLGTCSTTCNQEYRCDGNPIGHHTITRTYTKGRHNGQDVTFVDVTKT